MPLHDWTRVEAGIYHGFHLAWIAAIRGQLNTGLLPPGYYADAEQVVRPHEADVLTLKSPPTLFDPPRESGGVLLAEAPPRTRERVSVRPSAVPSPRQRRVAVRHVSGHRVVALIEVVSPANKDRPGSVEDFAEKVVEALRQGVNVLTLDLFPPGRHDPAGLHGAVLEALTADPDEPTEPPALRPPLGEPLAFASYRADEEVETFVEYRAVGAELPTMPLFLSAERYVDVPLGPSYDRAWAETPAYWRDVISPPG